MFWRKVITLFHFVTWDVIKQYKLLWTLYHQSINCFHIDAKPQRAGRLHPSSVQKRKSIISRTNTSQIMTFYQQNIMSHVILNNYSYNLNTVVMVIYSIFTTCTMSKAIAQNMKPIFCKNVEFLFVVCPNSNSSSCLSSTQTVLPGSP